MANLELKNLVKIYSDDVKAIKDFSLNVEDKEFIIFVGPSGCGKSTVLRMIAGLEEISDGELYIDGRLVNHVDPKDRDIAMVFQNYALYPHMTVFDNMAFGLKLRKIEKSEIKRRVTEAAEILEIKELLDRKPKALSGGQRQRVAMGRAIVRNPKVFLMDEPLSNLDAKLRVQMRSEISKLHQRLQTTFIYVTHDQTEAMTLGTRIVVMKSGVIQQVDSPTNLYNKPANLFVASFIGSPQMNLLDVAIEEENDSIIANFGGNIVKIPKEKAEILKEKGYIGKEAIIGIRPEHMHHEDTTSVKNKDSLLKAKVEVLELLGAEVYLYLNSGGVSVTARVTPRHLYEVGESIRLIIDTEKLHFFDKDTQLSIVN
ncbi:MAG: sn-glycerol-3-phosphate ABC transporter ATP-binding protein UgpC [Defluviitaleaceae bacterium]|nr:sn-glycerol-3-phosphate ABC transporter ATP-binding protein UgpC [Defluviitaleaceae bacterium]